MSDLLPLLAEDEIKQGTPAGDGDGDTAGFGALRTERGLLPLKAMEIHGRIDGLLAQVAVRQTFANHLDEPLEATYIFPLPDRAAVTRFRMEVAGRVIEGVLEERGQARKEYREAIEAGHRASIAEEERPGVFTMRVGNLPPGEEAVIELDLTGPLPFADGEVTFRFPLVVAPRYIPGTSLPGPSTGQGVAHDTDAVPDASRISPPVLLPGFPNPVALALTVEVHESVAAVGSLRSSLHAVVEQAGPGYRRVSLHAGERLNRDFILRFKLGAESIDTSLSVHPDPGPDGNDEGTFALTIVPPTSASRAARPRDMVFVLDRSGSMGGWKMVAARRALARMVDTLGAADRFNVLAFDDMIESPPSFPAGGLVAATDRQRFRAVEFLTALDSRGGTEMAEPLSRAVDLLAHDETSQGQGRDRVLVLVTDGQVGNEDQILRGLGPRIPGIRVFTLGIDRAVNEGFLRRLAELGGGACEIVESEDRLDEVMDAVHRRIGTPVLTALRLEPASLPVVPDTLVPGRIPDLFASAPVLILGRYRGAFPSSLSVAGQDTAGAPWSETVAATVRDNPAIAAAWARGQLRKLEDRYAVEPTGRVEVEQAIVATSLKFGVLCRFTAYVAVDRTEVVNQGGQLHKVIQPVESPEGWEFEGRVGGIPESLAMLSSPAPMRAMGRRVSGRALKTGPTQPDEEVMFAPPPAMAFGPLEVQAEDEPFDLAFLPTAPPEPDESAAGSPDTAGPRARAGELLRELEIAIRHRGKALLDALRTLVPQLEALLTELKSLGDANPGLPELEGLLEELRRIMGTANLTAETVEVMDLDDLASSVAVVSALLATGADPGPGSAEPERESFWK